MDDIGSRGNAMRLIDRRLNRSGRSERGATIVFVVLGIVGILGMASIVIDVGALRQERRTLQNGADAAALAVARDCIDGNCGAVLTTAGTYANLNADDGKAIVDQLCGYDKSATMPACTGPAVTPPVGALGWVKAKTRTLDGAGNQKVMFGFGRIFGQTGAAVNADAYTAWGSPARVTDVPLMFADCEYQRWKSAGGDIVIKNVYDSPACTNTKGGNPSGGFSWQEYSSNCLLETTITSVSGTDVVEVLPQGNGKNKATRPPPGCNPTKVSALLNQLIRVPIWDSSVDCGGHLQYTIVGFALFRITGIAEVNGNINTNMLAGECPDGRCFKGHFESLVEAAKTRFGGVDYGNLTYRLFNADNSNGNFT